MTLTLRYAARSDRGLIRDGNQDSVYAGPRLLAVADGMGGMAAGDVASNIVIGALAPLDEDVPGNDLVGALSRAVGTANQQLRATVDANPQLEGMGTTLTAMLFSGSRFGMAHVGDSRAYLLRDGQFHQVTKDDTYVQMLVDEGRISAEEASSHPQRSLLTRALDGRDVDPEYSVREARPGDRYLICSDGLSAVVSFDTIGDALRDVRDPRACVEMLVNLALKGGGPDNVTVIVADVTDADIVEGVPIVGGAAARDRDSTSTVDLSSSAARAAALTPRPAAPAEQPAEEPEDPPRRHPVRTTVLALLALLLLSGAGFGGWQYTQRQYYVGASNGVVAVFQGVPGQFAGLQLSRVYLRSDRALTDLTQFAQDRVRKGIVVPDLNHARAVLSELTDDSPTNSNLLPMCPTPTPVPPSPTVRPTPKVTAKTPVKTPAPKPSPSLSPTPTASPTPEVTGPCRTRK